MHLPDITVTFTRCASEQSGYLRINSICYRHAQIDRHCFDGNQETASWSLHIQTNKSVCLFKKINNKKHPSLHTRTQMFWLILLTYASELYHWIIYSKNLHTSTHTYTRTHIQTSTGKNRNAPIRLPVTSPTLYHIPSLKHTQHSP